MTTLPPSVNFHMWPRCDMRCRFCFSRGLRPAGRRGSGALSKDEVLRVATHLAREFEKVSVSGGEPTLCPFLVDVADAIASEGATCMLITNGARLLADGGILDRLTSRVRWIGVSVDSSRPEVLAALGRSVRGRPLASEEYIALADQIQSHGIGLKVNTVVTRLNAGEDMAHLIAAMHPARWKVLQAVAIRGSNETELRSLAVTPEAFRLFVERHTARLGPLVTAESRDMIAGSYAMVAPSGRFFDNVAGQYCFSRPILEVGVTAAFSDVHFNMDRFCRRGGRWDWSEPSSPLTEPRRAG